MRELSSRAQAILDAARDGDDPSADDKARVRRAVLASIGGGALGSASGSAAAASGLATGSGSGSATAGAAGSAAVASGAGAAAGTTAVAGGAGAAVAGTAAAGGTVGLGSGLLAKVLVATVAVGTVAGTATLVSWDDSTPSSAEFAHADVATVSVQGDDEDREEASIGRFAPASDDAPAADPEDSALDETAPGTVAAPEAATAAPAATPAPAAARTPTAAPEHDRPRLHPRDRAARAASAGEPETLAEEVAMLRQAQRARGRGEPAEALRLLELHAARFPEGVLSAERAAALALALCDLGREAEARAAADRFVASHPSSPLRARVAAACR